MTLGENFKVFETIMGAAVVALGGFLWNLNSNVAVISDNLVTMKASIEKIDGNFDKIDDKQVDMGKEVARINEAMKYTLTKSDLMEYMKK